MRNDLLLCHLVSFEVFFLFVRQILNQQKKHPNVFFFARNIRVGCFVGERKNLIANQHKIFIFVWSLEALPLRRGWILRTKIIMLRYTLPMHHHFWAVQIPSDSYETPRFPIFLSTSWIVIFQGEMWRPIPRWSIHSNGAGLYHIPVIQNFGGQTWHFLRQQTVPGNSASLWPFRDGEFTWPFQRWLIDLQGLYSKYLFPHIDSIQNQRKSCRIYQKTNG